MKKILITGANSFIGTSFSGYLEEFPGEYEVATMSLMDGTWREKSFSGYDTVYHVAGIAHCDDGKFDEAKKELYKKVNADLAIDAAKKAKADGVKQFIFMSSAIIYGDSAPIGKRKIITKDTPVAPANYYGMSKLMAEEGLLPLSDKDFKVVILRPPMVYGKGCKGNYPVLANIAQKMRFFPNVKNERSMLYVGNLARFVKLMIDNEESGIFFPQNPEYSNTSLMVKQIAAEHERKVTLIKGLSWLLKLAALFTPLVNKAFGSLAYDKSLSEYKQPYAEISLAESLKLTEARKPAQKVEDE